MISLLLIFYRTTVITFTLEKHAISVYRNLPSVNLKGSVSKFYDTLPFEFNREKYLAVAKIINLKDKTAEGYITKLLENNLLERVFQNHYIKKQN